MGQRVRRSHRGQCPSSARQLPILAALHARSPTLFFHIIHEKAQNVNPFFKKKYFLSIASHLLELHRATLGAFVNYDEIPHKTAGYTLAFCAIWLYNVF